MGVILNLAPEIERRLREKAAQEGQSLEDYLRRLAEESLGAEPPPSRPSADEWEAELRAWAASHPTLSTIADDSRESIY